MDDENKPILTAFNVLCKGTHWQVQCQVENCIWPCRYLACQCWFIEFSSLSLCFQGSRNFLPTFFVPLQCFPSAISLPNKSGCHDTQILDSFNLIPRWFNSCTLIQDATVVLNYLATGVLYNSGLKKSCRLVLPAAQSWHVKSSWIQSFSPYWSSLEYDAQIIIYLFLAQSGFQKNPQLKKWRGT